MSEWKKLVIAPHASIREAIRCIDVGGMQIALVANEANHLLGTISDGDIRRGILRGIPLEAPATSVMNASPVVARPGRPRDELIATMRARQLYRIPVVGSCGELIGFETLNELVLPARRENVVVLMAGGLGSRLRPLTEECPKPMLTIGKRPILETILLNFLECGFHRFYVSVNYMAEVITGYFGDGSKWGAEIRYIHEPERLGTAGAVRLMPERPAAPVVVMNGDLLTKVNFGSLLDFHLAHHSSATMCVREYDFQVPYGVVRLDEHRLVGIDEKPVHRFFVNAGIYVLSPEALPLIPPGFYDMPTLFENLVANGLETAAFPIREYWLDIGRRADLDKANGEFDGHFS